VADGGIDPADAGPGGDLTKISCGSTQCFIPGETCCIARLPNGPPDHSYSCVNGPGCPPAAGGADTTALKCSGAANCAAGTVCCVRQNNNTTASECKATCAGNEAQLCDPAAATSGCAAGTACSNKNITDWWLPRTFATCGGKGN
jgi:hypothetical protein